MIFLKLTKNNFFKANLKINFISQPNVILASIRNTYRSCFSFCYLLEYGFPKNHTNLTKNKTKTLLSYTARNAEHLKVYDIKFKF